MFELANSTDWFKIKFLLDAFIGVGSIGCLRHKQKEKTNYLLRLRRWRFHL